MSAATAVVDFGSSHTVTVLHLPGRAPRLVTVDGEPWVSSAVFLNRDDQLVVGQDAMRMAIAEPARLETDVKSKIDEREVLLGDTVLPVTTLVRAVLGKVMLAATGLAGGPVQQLVLTHPADWGATRLGTLLSAAQGLAPRVSTVAEPVGAAAWFATHDDSGEAGDADDVDARLPTGSLLAVLDLGGGTCDVAVVRRTATGIEVVGCAGIPDLGGADFDERIADHLRDTVPGLADRLASIDAAATPGRIDLAPLRELVAFRQEVRRAKELLSRHPQVEVALPGGLPDALLTRSELESIIGPDLDRITAFTLRAIVSCGVEPTEPRALQLVGGSARIPMLSRMLGEVLDVPIRLDDQPEAVVALGAAALAAGPDTGRAPTEPTPAAAPETDTVGSSWPDKAPASRVRRPVPALVAAVLLLVATVVAGFVAAPGPTAGAPGVTTAKVTLPAPAEGNAMVLSGTFADGLTQTQPGVPVRVNDGLTDADWTVHSVTDPATEELVELGAVDPGESARWVLVDTVLELRADAERPYFTGDTYLVDDRGLLIEPSIDVPLPDRCPFEAPATATAGQQLHQCYAFAVSAWTPVRAVVISQENTIEHSQLGAMVPVTGPPVQSGPAPASVTVPLGVPRPLRFGDTTVRAAVVDVVTEPSAYFDLELVHRPGSRGVLVRALVEADRHVSVGELGGLMALRDDRRQFIGSQSFSDEHGCSPQRDDQGTPLTATGRIVVCNLFVVPSGMPLDTLSWLGTDDRGYFWDVS